MFIVGNSIRAYDQLFFSLGGDLWKNKDFKGHGIILAHYKTRINNKSSANLAFNTDTLFTNYQTEINKKFSCGASLKGELNLAGLLTDYYKQGELIKEGGFKASFIETSPYIIYHFNLWNNLKLELSTKKWFFKESDNTSSSFTLPSDFWEFSPKIIYTFWQLKNDASFHDEHRFFHRLDGLAFSIIGAVNFRNQANKWGFTSSTNDRINNPKTSALLLKQWLGFGINLGTLRIQLKETAFFSENSDDINNARVGGMNPYVTPIAGMPWASFIVNQYLSAHPALYFKIFGESELGIQMDFVYLKDVNRTGSKQWGSAIGLSLHADVRINSWQFDLKGGYTLPASWMEKEPHYSIFFAAGNVFNL